MYIPSNIILVFLEPDQYYEIPTIDPQREALNTRDKKKFDENAVYLRNGTR